MVAFILLANHNIVEQAGAMSVRSFFGVTKVSETPDGQFRLLQHGTTLHGGQRIREFNGDAPADPPELLMYYWDGSAISQAFDAVRARVAGPIRYAVVGLGAGSLACRAEPGDTVHFYEIDPAMISIARDPYLFSFLWLCRPVATITLGDARLTLADAPDGDLRPHRRRRLLVRRDPHSPAHPRSDGDVQGQAPAARHAGDAHIEPAPRARVRGRGDRRRQRNDHLYRRQRRYRRGGQPVQIFRHRRRRRAQRGRLRNARPIARDWELKTPDPAQWVWTDDYSNIVGAVIRKLKE